MPHSSLCLQLCAVFLVQLSVALVLMIVSVWGPPVRVVKAQLGSGQHLLVATEERPEVGFGGLGSVMRPHVLWELGAYIWL